MLTFFKTVIKAITIVAASFIMALLWFVPFNISPNAGIIWLVFCLVAIVAVMITLCQENIFSKKVNKIGKAFWEW